VRIVIATTHTPFVHGGAEELALSLRKALISAGHKAEIIAIPFRWWPPAKILDHMLACRLLDVSETAGEPIDLCIGLKFPAYHLVHPRKRIWLVHEYRTAYSLWDHPIGDLVIEPEGQLIRQAIVKSDHNCFCGVEKLFAISSTVTKRVEQHLGLDAPPLYHPPPGAERLRGGEADGYFYFPSRICSYKRQRLVIEALAHTSQPVEVQFSGAPETSGILDELQRLALTLGVSSRVRWLGHVSDDEKTTLYANALGVVFPPVDEDYGYITLEAMLSSKPVITCTDSGGPLEFVIPDETGLVSEATPQALAGCMDELWSDRQRAARMGRAGREHYDGLQISWEHVVEKLCGGI
jgi:glycosyltransferase involved in cell wall biosynthesis